jgi:hypothetical protein
MVIIISGGDLVNMNLYSFMNESPLTTCILIFIILFFVCNTIFRCFNGLIRHLNIRKHGWPPEHCDADGDIKQQESKGD